MTICASLPFSCRSHLEATMSERETSSQPSALLAINFHCSLELASILPLPEESSRQPRALFPVSQFDICSRAPLMCGQRFPWVVFAHQQHQGEHA